MSVDDITLETWADIIDRELRSFGAYCEGAGITLPGVVVYPLRKLADEIRESSIEAANNEVQTKGK